VPREDIDIDLMTQIVIQMGRQLAQETMTDGVVPSADDRTSPRTTSRREWPAVIFPDSS
jgi:hypothetical protein